MIEIVKEKLLLIHGLKAPRWEDSSSINFLTENCRIALAQIEYLSINKKLVEIQNHLSDLSLPNNAHPINKRILSAFQERDANLY